MRNYIAWVPDAWESVVGPPNQKINRSMGWTPERIRLSRSILILVHRGSAFERVTGLPQVGGGSSSKMDVNFGTNQYILDAAVQTGSAIVGST